MNIVVYSRETGEILRNVSCPPEMVDVQCDDAIEAYIEHDPVNTELYSVIDGNVVAKEKMQIAKSYAQLRWENYPSIEDQLDILYHHGFDAWRNTISEIKNKYPK